WVAASVKSLRLPVAAFFARGADTGGLSLHHQPVLGERVMAKNFALEDPHFDSANTVSGVRCDFGIIDVTAQRVQRHPALAVPFGAGDFRSTETAGAGDADALRTETQSRLNRALHRTPEG